MENLKLDGGSLEMDRFLKIQFSGCFAISSRKGIGSHDLPPKDIC